MLNFYPLAHKIKIKKFGELVPFNNVSLSSCPLKIKTDKYKNIVREQILYTCTK